ncbi:MAG: hypothetical protein PHE27_02010 [Alphaproteobacteria bacterium]|nr:hypothetical protein [Alphaproteobacteria bacterium]
MASGQKTEDREYNLYNLHRLYDPDFETQGYSEGRGLIAVKRAFRDAEFEVNTLRGGLAGMATGLSLMFVVSPYAQKAGQAMAAVGLGEASVLGLVLAEIACVLPAAAAMIPLFVRAKKRPVFHRQLDLLRPDPSIVGMEKAGALKIVPENPDVLPEKRRARFVKFVAEEKAALYPDVAGACAIFSCADLRLSQTLRLPRKTRGFIFPKL